MSNNNGPVSGTQVPSELPQNHIVEKIMLYKWWILGFVIVLLAFYMYNEHKKQNKDKQKHN